MAKTKNNIALHSKSLHLKYDTRKVSSLCTMKKMSSCAASIQFRQGQQIFIFSKAPRPNLGVHAALYSLGTGSPRGVKWLRHDADHTCISSRR